MKTMVDKDSVSLKWNRSGWEKSYRELREHVSTKQGAALFMVMETVGKDMQSYAKRSAPWTDRTTRARTSLIGGARTLSANQIASFIAHGVYYGQYLEFSHQKRFAILHPTINKFRPELNKKITQFIKGLGRYM